jgi:hypothetical protein
VALEPYVLKLETPITFGKVTVEELTFQPCKARHLVKCVNDKQNVVPYMIELAGYLTGQTSQIIGELEGEDIWRVIGVTSDFFAGSQPTGETQSP